MLLTLTSVLAAMLLHFHADPLSAEERQLVGTWRRFDAEGQHVCDERYSEDRTLKRRWPIGDDEAQMGEWYEVESVRWAYSDGEIRLHRPISFDERADMWTGGRYVYVGDFAFPKTSRRRSTYKYSFKQIGLALCNYAETYGARPLERRKSRMTLGDMLRVTLSDYPGEVHTLCRLLNGPDELGDAD